jgi:hypothetical protein
VRHVPALGGVHTLICISARFFFLLSCSRMGRAALKIGTVLGVLLALYGLASLVRPTPKRVPYNANEICAGAFQADQHFEQSKENHIEIELHENCWSGFVYVPLWWVFGGRGFYSQPTGDLKGFWSAYWFAGRRQWGPFDAARNPTFFQSRGRVLRLQGHGTLTLYTNQPPNPNSKRF